MNREIKFRGKRLDNGEWVYGYLSEHWSLNTGEHYFFISTIEEDELGHKYTEIYKLIDPATVGQFIGVTDEAGSQELFDGDIIKIVYFEEPFRCEIKHEGSGYILISESFPGGFIWASDYLHFEGDACWIIGSEKIGNIHDNPELLMRRDRDD